MDTLSQKNHRTETSDTFQKELLGGKAKWKGKAGWTWKLEIQRIAYKVFRKGN